MPRLARIFCWCAGTWGGKVSVLALMAMGRSQGPELLDDVGDGQGGDHDGQVGFNGVAGAVGHRAGSQVTLGHSE